MEKFVRQRYCQNKALVNAEFRGYKHYTIDQGVLANHRPPKDTFSPNIFGKQVDDDDLINHPVAWLIQQTVPVGMPPRCVAPQQGSKVNKQKKKQPASKTKKKK